MIQLPKLDPDGLQAAKRGALIGLVGCMIVLFIVFLFFVWLPTLIGAGWSAVLAVVTYCVVVASSWSYWNAIDKKRREEREKSWSQTPGGS